MNPGARVQVAGLPFVRAVVPHHPAYRLEEFMRDNLARSAELFPLLRYNIQVFEPRADQKGIVAARIEALGAAVNTPNAGKSLLQATLADFTDPDNLNSTAGVAVVPIPPPPIPALSAWGVMTMTIFLLIGGTLVLIRRGDGTMRIRSRCLWAACPVTAFPSPSDGGGP